MAVDDKELECLVKCFTRPSERERRLTEIVKFNADIALRPVVDAATRGAPRLQLHLTSLSNEWQFLRNRARLEESD